MFLKSIPKLLGVVAMAVTAGLSGSGVASAASVPWDGGDVSCLRDQSGCYLYHFKLGGEGRSIKFTIFDDPCSYWNSKRSFSVMRKNSANIWLDRYTTHYFSINFDGRAAVDTQGTELYDCGGNAGVYTFINKENKCWYFAELRTRGDKCDWR